jgi:tagatose 1,6-diphosphate aldolase
VIGSVEEFARPEYGVDLFKLETPLPAASLPPLDGSAASRAAAGQFEAIGELCRKAGAPWVMLSGGAEVEQFERVLSYAYGAGAQGFLAGRTIWLHAIEAGFPDAGKVTAALQKEGNQRLVRLKELTARVAKPWAPHYEKMAGVVAEGDFARLHR